MILKRLKIACQNLCKLICNLRAGGRCEICGDNQNLESHHIGFGAGKCDPRTAYDSDFYARLCHFHHQVWKYAPHINREEFLKNYLPLIQTERALKIKKILSEPYIKQEIDLKEIFQKLTEQAVYLQDTSWMDDAQMRINFRRKAD